jgi:hypothetical protein
MMNTTKILKNSWNLMLRYRALWIFGVVLALTTVSFGSTLWMRDQETLADRTLVNWEINAKDQAWIKENFDLNLPQHYTLKVKDMRVNLDDSAFSAQERIAITAGVFAAIITLLVLILGFHYTAEASLIIMVNEHQQNNQEYRARQGWALGFSMTAVRLFLIDLMIYSLLFLFTILIFLPPLLPLFIAITGTPAGITVGVLLMTSLSLVSLAVLIVMWLTGGITRRLARRACCVEDLGVFTAIWRGYRLMRHQLSGVGLTWLVIAGLDLVYPILAAPVAILLAATGLFVGGLLALILGALLALVIAKVTAWTIALVVGIILLALVVFVPMVMLAGLREVFTSAAWTLTFIEAAAQPGDAPAPRPALLTGPQPEPA